MKKIILFIFLPCIFIACSQTPSVEGTWVQPIPLQKGKFHGMIFEKNGQAQSINMPLLQYQTWQQKDNQLTLTGKTMYGGENFVFSESYTIKSVTPVMLVLVNNNGEELVFARQN